MNTLLKLFSLLVVTLILSSCSTSGTELLNSFAGSEGYTKVSNVKYGAYSQNTLDVYQPTTSASAPSKPKPVIVFFYGGCWGQCSDLKKSSYLFVAQSFASRGFTTVIADFRQYPAVNFATLMGDASNVMAWTSRNIARYGGDPRRIVVAGHSSGAHIAAMLALNPRYRQNGLRGFIGLAGPYDFLPLDEDYQRVIFNSANNYANSQPINFVTKQSPPLLILHGEKDTTVGKHNAVNLSAKAKKKGVDHKLILYPSHSHTSILAALSRPLQGRTRVLTDMLTFIQEHTR
ncbi:MAG: alpha/beta hydrolase [Cocleimonas sp.]|nr:alpha/beta hydrolase [Cocleimonas sp.]